MSNLPGGTHILSGIESQRLRSYCSSESYSSADLDDYAILLQNAEVAEVRDNFESRVKKTDAATAKKELAAIQYGPTKIPIFNYLLQLTILRPQYRTRYLNVARYLALEAEVPVDSTDLSGTTPFMYSISTKPYWDKEFAGIMLAGGAKVNQRNRYGCTAAHDIAMVRDLSIEGKRKTVDAVKFFVEKGGDLDIQDGDGVSARRIGTSVARMVPNLEWS